MSAVYLVYIDDYRRAMVAVFSNKTLAKRFIALFDEPLICKEYHLDPFAEEIDQGLRPYVILMTREGRVVEVHQENAYGFSLMNGQLQWRTSPDFPEPYFYHISMAGDIEDAVEQTETERKRLLVEEYQQGAFTESLASYLGMTGDQYDRWLQRECK